MVFARWTKAVATLLCATLVLVCGCDAVLADETNAFHGVIATFKTSNKTDALILPNLWLYIQKGDPPTPFVAGDYTVEMTGFVSVDLRGQYSFRAEVSGTLVLELNGNPVLEAANTGDHLSEPAKTVRLNKGTNTITAKFTPPKDRDAMLRVYWVPKDKLPSSIPDSALTYIPTDQSRLGTSLRHGRTLFAEFRCARCHKTELAGMPELAMDAPSFDGIGSRLNDAWMAKWIENPSEQRARARMPRLLYSDSTRQDSTRIAAFLATLKSDQTPPSNSAPEKEQLEKGQHLFQTLHCGACHNAPGSDEKDPARISLDHVRQKFQSGALNQFLLNPQALYSWIRMPDFKLTSDEARDLASFLNSKASAPATPEFSTQTDSKQLLTTVGCLNCHSLKGETSSLAAKNLGDITRGNLESGCLNPASPGKAPKFSLDDTALRDLRAFLKSEVPSLGRDLPREFASRQTELLNCAGCHGKFEGFPHLGILGEKLRPEWSEKFIAGQIPYKPRPWLDSRMPAFPTRARELAQGLAALHGYPPATPVEAPIDKEMAEVGRKLVSPAGGFSCTSCHAVGESPATQVIEAAGINLAYTGERILKPFFHRWVMNPLAMDPTTKMPVYFDNEGRSQLTDIYDGVGQKQIEAIWQYIRMGSKMPAPLQ